MRAEHPRLIQGGMGIGVSNWRLAQAVSRCGQIGTVSGTGIWLVMARNLQMGDPGGHIRRALAHFPIPSISESILDRHYIEGGKAEDNPFRGVKMLTHPLPADLAELMVAASFVEVWLAREGHDGVIGVNYLEKIQLSHLPSLYGAMLAGVDYVLMGAGIPIQIAEALDNLSRHERATYRLQVEGAGQDDIYEAEFDPRSLPYTVVPAPLKRPHFLPIVSSHVLAQVLIKRSKGRIDGFVVEGPTAGGHNAPPRNRKELTAQGEPLYGPQDAPDLGKIGALGLPFWLAGSQSGPDGLREAMAKGAHGIQVGSVFALSRESGIVPSLKQEAIARALGNELTVGTNGQCSPSGYPFKEAALPGTLTDPAVIRQRQLTCDVGALRTLYKRPDGQIGYRCAAEPTEQYVKKGGLVEDTLGKRCLCNALLSTMGAGQVRPEFGYVEPPLLTLGTDLGFLRHLAADGEYSAEEAVEYVMSGRPAVHA